MLGHFYQRDEVVEYADFVGDSFQLAKAARTRPEAEAIIFCGVHFMAETADMLSRPDQAVILPNLAAGCSMADMADIDSVTECWEQLEEVYGTEPDADGRVPVIPVTYMNSSAALKGFCGEHGGIVCTSSNAATVLEWAFERGQRVLFFPDQHLGRNTAKAMGVPTGADAACGTRARPSAATTRTSWLEARVMLWHGFCSVHKRFTVDQIDKARAELPGVHVIVHPECPMPVVDAADSAGSTDFINKAIAAATEPAPRSRSAPRSTWSTGWPREYPQHTIFCLDPVICPCSTMYRIHPGYLAWVLEALVGRRGGQPHHRCPPTSPIRRGSHWSACSRWCPQPVRSRRRPARLQAAPFPARRPRQRDRHRGRRDERLVPAGPARPGRAARRRCGPRGGRALGRPHLGGTGAGVGHGHRATGGPRARRAQRHARRSPPPSGSWTRTWR